MPAYSYVRFSTPPQSLGDSERRQIESTRNWAKRKGIPLDESLTPDRGLSGFHGTHRRRGSLGKFLQLVREGVVPSGSILVVERASRLSREGAFKAMKDVVFELLGAGITLQFTDPELAFTEENYGLMSPLLNGLLELAYRESKDRSDYAKSQWGRRRAAAAESGKPVNGNGPAWLRLVDGNWQPIPEKVKAVRKVFERSIDGHGVHSLCAELNRLGVPPIGRGRKWLPHYVALVLRNRAVLGEFQPAVMKDGRRCKDGIAPVQGYYPPVLPESVFRRAQAAMDARKLKRGPKGRHCRNLFTGMLYGAVDGFPLVTVSEHDSNKGVRLVSAGARTGNEGSSYKSVPYAAVETAFLSLVTELTPQDLQPRSPGPGDDLVVLEGRKKDLKARIDKLRTELRRGGDFADGLQLLRELGDDALTLDRQIEQAKGKAASPPSAALEDAQSIVQVLAKAKGEKLVATRVRLQQRIREVFEQVWVFFADEAEGQGQLVLVQAFLRDNGDVRQIAFIRDRKTNNLVWLSHLLKKDQVADLRLYRDEKKGRAVRQWVSWMLKANGG